MLFLFGFIAAFSISSTLPPQSEDMGKKPRLSNRHFKVVGIIICLLFFNLFCLQFAVLPLKQKGPQDLRGKAAKRDFFFFTKEQV
jgi:hypothetical protein